MMKKIGFTGNEETIKEGKYFVDFMNGVADIFKIDNVTCHDAYNDCVYVKRSVDRKAEGISSGVMYFKNRKKRDEVDFFENNQKLLYYASKQWDLNGIVVIEKKENNKLGLANLTSWNFKDRKFKVNRRQDNGKMKEEEVSFDEVIYIVDELHGSNPVSCYSTAKKAVSMVKSIDRWNEDFFVRGGMPHFIMQVDKDVKSKKEFETLMDLMKKMRGENAVPLVRGDFKIIPLNMERDSDWDKLMQRNIDVIRSSFGVNGYVMGETKNVNYNNGEGILADFHRSISFRGKRLVSEINEQMKKVYGGSVARMRQIDIVYDSFMTTTQKKIECDKVINLLKLGYENPTWLEDHGFEKIETSDLVSVSDEIKKVFEARDAINEDRILVATNHDTAVRRYERDVQKMFVKVFSIQFDRIRKQLVKQERNDLRLDYSFFDEKKLAAELWDEVKGFYSKMFDAESVRVAKQEKLDKEVKSTSGDALSGFSEVKKRMEEIYETILSRLKKRINKLPSDATDEQVTNTVNEVEEIAVGSQKDSSVLNDIVAITGLAGVLTASANDKEYEWVAINDDRTRSSHANTDGQVRGEDEFFSVGGNDARYPSDPRLPIEEQINCRCSIRVV